MTWVNGLYSGRSSTIVYGKNTEGPVKELNEKTPTKITHLYVGVIESE